MQNRVSMDDSKANQGLTVHSTKDVVGAQDIVAKSYSDNGME